MILTSKLPGHRFIKQPPEYIYLLSGLLKRGKCGSHYVCGRSKQGLGCDASRLSARGFDEALIDYFKRASNDQEIIIKEIGDAILDSQIKLEALEKLVKPIQNKLVAIQQEANKLLELAMNNRVSQGKTYKDKMAKLDEEIVGLEDELEKLQAKKSIAQMSAHSGEFLHSNLKFAMQYIEQAPSGGPESLNKSPCQGNRRSPGLYRNQNVYRPTHGRQPLMQPASHTGPKNPYKRKTPYRRNP